MREFFKRILGITALEEEILSLKRSVNDNIKTDIKIVQDDIKTLELVKSNKSAISDIQVKIGSKRVLRKLNNYKSEHEFIELSAKIYVLDNGWRKENPPYIKSDSNGVVDEYNDDLGPDTKLRCYIVKRLVMPGYGNEEKYDPNSDKFEDTMENLFGMSYRELVDYMREHNYKRVDNEMYSLNFYEI